MRKYMYFRDTFYTETLQQFIVNSLLNIWGNFEIWSWIKPSDNQASFLRPREISDVEATKQSLNRNENWDNNIFWTRMAFGGHSWLLPLIQIVQYVKHCQIIFDFNHVWILFQAYKILQVF